MKTIAPAKRRIPGQFNNAKRLFAGEDKDHFMSETNMSDNDLSDDLPLMNK